MRILGIDPGYAIVGYGVLDYAKNRFAVVGYGAITTKAHTPLEEMLCNVKSNVRNGSIILMHDFIGKNSPTPEALRQIIPMLLELGYEFVTVSQLLEGG